MSVINEALKRAGEPEKKQTEASVAPPPLAKPVKAARPLTAAWTVAILAVLIAIASLYMSEFQSRQKTQAKLQAALLQLNNARSEAVTAMEQKEWALAEQKAIAAKAQEVEYDNFEKEKKIADLSKEVHELKMTELSSVQPTQA